MALRRVVATGIGMVTPVGNGVEATWKAHFSGRSGIRKLTSDENPDIQGAGEIIGGAAHSDFSRSFWKAKLQGEKGDAEAITMCSVDEALKDMGWKPTTDEEKERCGCVYGSSTYCTSWLIKEQKSLPKPSFSSTTPEMMFRQANTVTGGEVARYCDFRGPFRVISNACASGALTIGMALRAIQWGEADVMMASCSHDSVDLLLSLSMYKAGAALIEAEDPDTCCRPFDMSRKGTVMSMGAGAMVFEELSHALKRGAKIYGELVGFSSGHEGGHPVRPRDDGNGIFMAMSQAISESRVPLEEIRMIRSHSTGTVQGDFSEAVSIRKAFGNLKPSVSTLRGHTGHISWPSGLMEAGMGLLSMNRGIVPPILNLEHPMTFPDGETLNFAARAMEMKSDAVLINSMGFGGVCATLVFSKLKDVDSRA